MKGETVFMDELGRKKYAATRVNTCAQRETSKTMVVPRITIRNLALCRAVLDGNGFVVRLPLPKTCRRDNT